MSQVLDFYDDHGAYLAHVVPSLEFAKEASWQPQDHLLDRDFALIALTPEGSEVRKYPINDRGNAYSSVLYFHKFGSALHPAAYSFAKGNLVEACKRFGLDVPEFLKTATAIPHGDFKVVDERRIVVPWLSLQEPELKKEGAFDKLAAVQLNWDDMDMFDRRESALELIQLAEHGVVVPQRIGKYAGVRLSPLFESRVQHRAKFYARDSEQAEMYDRLSKVAYAMTDLDDAVEALCMLDEMSGLWGKYGSSTVPDPILTVYEAIPEAEWSWTDGVRRLTRGDLIKAATSEETMGKVASALAPEVAHAFKLSPVELFDQLPAPLQRVVHTIIK